MLPSLGSLQRERALLTEVLRSSPASSPAPSPASRPRPAPVPPKAEPAGAAAGRSLSRWSRGDGLQHLPRELLADIAENFLESPVWHLCQLGAAAPRLGQVFMDEALWRSFLRERFGGTTAHQRGSRSQSPSARLSYAHLHELEARFRGGLYGARGTLDHPRQGVAVLDIQVAPAAHGHAADGRDEDAAEPPAVAFAALRDGCIAMYPLEQPGPGAAAAQAGARPRQALPTRELTPKLGGGPALCCLPVGVPRQTPAEAAAPAPGILAAGYALGRLAAWELPSGNRCTPGCWEAAHAGRVCALATAGDSGGGGLLLSASSDGVVKAWSLDAERFGAHRRSFSGHEASVVSVAASPWDRFTFLTGSHDRSLLLWDTRVGGAGAAVARWRQQDWVTCVEFHPTDQDVLLSSDKAVRQWDFRRPGSGALGVLHRHRKLVSRFRVDPLRLASCSLDGSVKVSSLEPPEFRVASPRGRAAPEAGSPCGKESDEVCTLRTSTDYVLCIGFDATRLLAGGVDGRVELFDFSQPGHFRKGTPSPLLSPAAARCGDPVDVQMTGLQELEI